MKLFAFVLTCLVFNSLPAIAQMKNGATLYDGANSVLNLQDSNPPVEFVKNARFAGYVNGVIDGNSSIANCLPNGVTTGQLATIAAKYIVSHDEKRHLSGNQLIEFAFAEAFPACRKTFAPEKKQ